MIDDILVYGSSIEEHNERLQAVLNRLKSAPVTLNQSKCEFGKETIEFLGHVINSNGISADPQKIETIVKMKLHRQCMAMGTKPRKCLSQG